MCGRLSLLFRRPDDNKILIFIYREAYKIFPSNTNAFQPAPLSGKGATRRTSDFRAACGISDRAVSKPVTLSPLPYSGIKKGLGLTPSPFKSAGAP